MYDYVTSKPPLNEDTLMHYGIKGMKWHKRKGKVLELKAKIKRRLHGVKDPAQVSGKWRTSGGHMDDGIARSTSSVYGNNWAGGVSNHGNRGFSKEGLNKGAYKDQTASQTNKSTLSNYYKGKDGTYYYSPKLKKRKK